MQVYFLSLCHLSFYKHIYSENLDLPERNLLEVSPFPLKTLSFSRSPQNLSQKKDDLGLIHRWIVVKFKHQVHNPITRILTIGNFKIMSDLIGKPFAL